MLPSLHDITDRFPGDHETERKGQERVNLKASWQSARLLGEPWKLLYRVVAEVQLGIGSRLGMNVDSRNLRERLTETELQLLCNAVDLSHRQPRLHRAVDGNR